MTETKGTAHGSPWNRALSARGTSRGSRPAWPGDLETLHEEWET